MKTRIICFGNPIMKDDGVGIRIAEDLRRAIEKGGIELDVVESAVAGYDLLDLFRDYERVVMVEAVKLPDKSPGDIIELEPFENTTYLRLCSSREAKIPEVMEAGKKLGYSMPEKLVLFGVQAEDVCTFGEGLSPSVAAAVPKVVEMLLELSRSS